MPSSRREPR